MEDSNENLIGWEQSFSDRLRPARMTCNQSMERHRKYPEEWCGSQDFEVKHLDDGVYIVCLKCETEFTIGEVLNSANAR